MMDCAPVIIGEDDVYDDKCPLRSSFPLLDLLRACVPPCAAEAGHDRLQAPN